MRVLPQLLTVLYLSFQQFSQFFIVVLQLFAFKCFSENIFTIIRENADLLTLVTLDLGSLLTPLVAGLSRRARGLACLRILFVIAHVVQGLTGGICGVEVVQNEATKIFDFFNILHQRFLIFLH